jgi:uncharacterized protein
MSTFIQIKTKCLIVSIALLSSVSLTSNVWAASFDCKKARTAVGKMICADEALSILDSKLKDVFDEAQSEHAGVDGETGKRIDPVGSDQKKWIKFVRNACKNESCLKYVYTARISELQEAWLSK